jgi:hypothetical protein
MDWFACVYDCDVEGVEFYEQYTKEKYESATKDDPVDA